MVRVQGAIDIYQPGYVLQLRTAPHLLPEALEKVKLQTRNGCCTRLYRAELGEGFQWPGRRGPLFPPSRKTARRPCRSKGKYLRSYGLLLRYQKWGLQKRKRNARKTEIKVNNCLFICLLRSMGKFQISSAMQLAILFLAEGVAKKNLSMYNNE